MRKVFDLLLVCFVFVLLFGGVNYVNIVVHEEAHVMIGVGHGCLDYVVEVGLSGGSFVCLDYGFRSEEERLQERYLHSLNEIVGYNVSLLVNVLLLGVFVVVIFLVYRRG